MQQSEDGRWAWWEVEDQAWRELASQHIDAKLLAAYQSAVHELEAMEPPLHKSEHFVDLCKSLRKPPGNEMWQAHRMALCTSHKNRLWQVRLALPVTLVHCLPHKDNVVIHFVDFDSEDGTLQWIQENCQQALECKLLRLYTSDHLPDWHASIAKNTAHMLCKEKEDICVNLDADNIVYGLWLKEMMKYFNLGYTIIHAAGNEGTCGRIASLTEHFRAVRGYDEDIFPMGGQDVDLVWRLQKLERSKYKRVADYAEAVPNSREEKIAYIDANLGRKAKDWQIMNDINVEVMKRRLQTGVIRNMHKAMPGVPAYDLVEGQTSDSDAA